MATMGRGLPLSKVRLTDIFHVLKHNEEICSAAENLQGPSTIKLSTAAFSFELVGLRPRVKVLTQSLGKMN